MARQYQINGETLVSVKFGAHIFQEDPDQVDQETSGLQLNKIIPLGLTDVNGKVMITPRFSHYDVKLDDFGPDIPAEIIWTMADVRIGMTLVHYDWDVLDICMSESMGGTVLGDNDGAGFMSPAGTTMRGSSAYLASGYYFVSLNIQSPVLNQPWHFPASYLTDIRYPLGTETSRVDLTWRAIPFMSGVTFSPGKIEFLSSGAILWDRTLDT